MKQDTVSTLQALTQTEALVVLNQAFQDLSNYPNADDSALTLILLDEGCMPV